MLWAGSCPQEDLTNPSMGEEAFTPQHRSLMCVLDPPWCVSSGTESLQLHRGDREQDPAPQTRHRGCPPSWSAARGWEQSSVCTTRDGAAAWLCCEGGGTATLDPELLCFLPFLREMMSSDCFSAEEAHSWMLHHGDVVSPFPAKLLVQPWWSVQVSCCKLSSFCKAET